MAILGRHEREFDFANYDTSGASGTGGPSPADLVKAQLIADEAAKSDGTGEQGEIKGKVAGQGGRASATETRAPVTVGGRTGAARSQGQVGPGQPAEGYVMDKAPAPTAGSSAKLNRMVGKSDAPAARSGANVQSARNNALAGVLIGSHRAAAARTVVPGSRPTDTNFHPQVADQHANQVALANQYIQARDADKPTDQDKPNPMAPGGSGGAGLQG